MICMLFPIRIFWAEKLRSSLIVWRGVDEEWKITRLPVKMFRFWRKVSLHCACVLVNEPLDTATWKMTALNGIIIAEWHRGDVTEVIDNNRANISLSSTKKTNEIADAIAIVAVDSRVPTLSCTLLIRSSWQTEFTPNLNGIERSTTKKKTVKDNKRTKTKIYNSFFA